MSRIWSPLRARRRCSRTPGQAAERLAAAIHERTFAAGEELTVEGHNGVGFFVIDSGEA